ncbi:MAG: hypothetical protein RSD47_08990 [Romboutsia sp.]
MYEESILVKKEMLKYILITKIEKLNYEQLIQLQNNLEELENK